MPNRELEDYERLHLLDSMYITEKMLEEEMEYYEYTRKVERQREVGRKYRSYAKQRAHAWVKKAVAHKRSSNR